MYRSPTKGVKGRLSFSSLLLHILGLGIQETLSAFTDNWVGEGVGRADDLAASPSVKCPVPHRRGVLHHSDLRSSLKTPGGTK